MTPTKAGYFLPLACYTVGMKTDDAQQPGGAAGRGAALVFLAKLRGTYDVAEAIMFGSRARGDNRPDSDLDLAVVLNGRRGDFIDTKLDMAGIAFDVLLETGVLVQAFPMWDGDLAHPERFTNPSLIQSISADGIRLG
jgi:predicted nucleotidyltransferase